MMVGHWSKLLSRCLVQQKANSPAKIWVENGYAQLFEEVSKS